MKSIRSLSRSTGLQNKLPSGRSIGLFAASAALVAAAVVVQKKTRQAQREHPPRGQFIEIDGTWLHYIERGSGQPVVLIHGNGTSIDDFEISGLVDLAAQRYRVIVFDRPGYGYSGRSSEITWTPEAQAALLQKALLRLNVDKPVVVGHSWGTLVAAAMAMNFPAYVKSLVLLSGYYYPTPKFGALLMGTPAIPIFGTLMRYTVSPLLGRLMWPLLLKKIFGPAEVPWRFRTHFPAWMSLRPSQLRASAAESALLIPAAYQLSERYKELIGLPVAIVAGDGDRIAQFDLHSRRLHRELPQSRFKGIHGEGHMIHHLVPHEVMAAIDSVAKTASTTGAAAAA